MQLTTGSLAQMVPKKQRELSSRGSYLMMSQAFREARQQNPTEGRAHSAPCTSSNRDPQDASLGTQSRACNVIPQKSEYPGLELHGALKESTPKHLGSGST